MKQPKPKLQAKQRKDHTAKGNVVLTAKVFVEQLPSMKSDKSAGDNTRFIHDAGNKILGVRMGDIFALAKNFTTMPLNEVEKLLLNQYFEARMGAVSIMDFKARDKKTDEATRKDLFELYINHHNSINNWDMVDRSAPYVVGGYLMDKPRTILYKLARSKNVWERRTAIVATYFFIRQRDVDDTFRIAEIMVNDKEETIHKAVGSWVREAGKKDKKQLEQFLDRHAATMPRTMLRYAIEKLDKKEKELYMNAAKNLAKRK